MATWLADFAGGAASGLISSAVGSFFGNRSAKKQAALQRANWTYMQSNAHQLEVQDLKKAGLNPILSAGGGNMASAPASPDMGATTATTSALSNSIVSALNRGLEKDLRTKDLDNKMRELDIKEKELGIKKTDVDSQIKEREARINKLIEDTVFVRSENARQTEMNKAKLRQIAETIQMQWQELAGKLELMRKQGESAAAQASAYAAQARRTINLIDVDNATKKKLEEEVDYMEWKMADSEEAAKREFYDEEHGKMFWMFREILGGVGDAKDAGLEIKTSDGKKVKAKMPEPGGKKIFKR